MFKRNAQPASSRLDPTAKLAEGVTYGFGCVIGEQASIGKGTVIGNHVIIHPRTVVGEGCIIQDRVVLGKRPLSTGGAGSSPTATSAPAALVVGSRTKIGTASICYAAATIGDDVWIADGAIIREGAKIASEVRIGKQVIIEWEAVIGRGTRIQAFTLIGEKMSVGEWVFIGPGVMTMCDRDMLRAGYQVSPPTIKRGARLAGRVTLAPGVTIGEEATVLVGSVVLHDVPDKAVVVGYPARPTKLVQGLPSVEQG